MWLLELILVSLAVGIPLGIAMRVWDEWQERAKAERARETQTSSTQEVCMCTMTPCPHTTEKQ